MEKVQIHLGLRKLLDETDMSQTQLAHASGLSESYMSRIMSGERTPDFDSTRLICQALGITMSTLMCKSTLVSTQHEPKVERIAALLQELDDLIYPNKGRRKRPKVTGKGGGGVKRKLEFA